MNVPTFQINEDIAIRSGIGYKSYSIFKIVKETNTQYVLNNNIRVYKKDNSIVGDRYNKIEKLTPEIIDTISISNTKARISSVIAELNNYRNHIRNNNPEELQKLYNDLLTISKRLHNP